MRGEEGENTGIEERRGEEDGGGGRRTEAVEARIGERKERENR